VHDSLFRSSHSRRARRHERVRHSGRRVLVAALEVMATAIAILVMFAVLELLFA
jgi:hypothetical protein